MEQPLKEASLKHLTFKTVFLLALGWGKRRSEIHAGQNKNIRHQVVVLGRCLQTSVLSLAGSLPINDR